MRSCSDHPDLLLCNGKDSTALGNHVVISVDQLELSKGPANCSILIERLNSRERMTYAKLCHL